jgi:hypothetical protein
MESHRGPIALALDDKHGLVLAWMETVLPGESTGFHDRAGPRDRSIRLARYSAGGWQELPPAYRWTEPGGLELEDHVNGFSPEHTLSLVVLPTGELVIAAVVFESEEHSSVVLRSLHGETWKEERPVVHDEAGKGVEHALEPQLVVDGLGRAVLALRDGNNVRVFRREGSEWKPFTGRRVMAVSADEFRLALDAQDRPVVAHTELNAGFAVTAWTGDDWKDIPLPPFETLLPPDATGGRAVAFQPVLTRTPEGWIFGFTRMDYPQESKPRVAVHLWRSRGGAWEELGAPQPSTTPSFTYSSSAQWFNGRVLASFFTQGLVGEQYDPSAYTPPWREPWSGQGVGQNPRYLVEWKQHTSEGWKQLMEPQVTTNLIAPALAASSQTVCLAWTALKEDTQWLDFMPQPLRTRVQCFQ